MKNTKKYSIKQAQKKNKKRKEIYLKKVVQEQSTLNFKLF